MKKINAIAVSLFCSLIVIAVSSELQIVDGYSETYTRTLNVHYWGYKDEAFSFCQLQAGDRIEASFTLSNLGPYTATMPENPNFIISHNAYYRFNISFSINEEMGETPRSLISFPDTKGDSFSYTASKTGDYWIHYLYSGGTYIDGKDPVLTINYDIIKAQTPTPIPPAPTEQPTASPTIQPTSSPITQPESISMLYTAGIATLIILGVATIAITILKTRKHRMVSTAY